MDPVKTGNLIASARRRKKLSCLSAPLAAYTALKRDIGGQGISAEEIAQLQDILRTLQPGEQPPVPEDGVSVICWLELIPKQ